MCHTTDAANPSSNYDIKEDTVNTPVDRKAPKKEAAQPRTTFTHVIALTASNSSFAGWGPRISGPTALIKNWN
ncbi:MAG: hypothetical protein M3Z14_03215 [Candidatus Eremiobacteraeota bacterium]|nr:hypothetical protein [Candidatus Eremiobacteraeota bacterium]